ncbi:MAG: hypothetical protein ACLTBA_09915 [Roseburia intestinalis]
MKATGEVMSICHNFEGALMKAHPFSGTACGQPVCPMTLQILMKDELIEELAVVDDRRIWIIAEAMRRDIS